MRQWQTRGPMQFDRAVWFVHGWAGSNTGCLGGCIAHLLAQPDPTTLNKSGWLGAVFKVVRSGSSEATHTSLQMPWHLHTLSVIVVQYEYSNSVPS